MKFRDLSLNVLFTSILINVIFCNENWFGPPAKSFNADKWQKRLPEEPTSFNKEWRPDDSQVKTSEAVPDLEVQKLKRDDSTKNIIGLPDQISLKDNNAFQPYEGSNDFVSKKGNRFKVSKNGGNLTPDIPEIGWKHLQDGITLTAHGISESDWNKLNEDGFLTATGITVPGWNRENSEGNLKLPEEYKPYPENYLSKTAGYDPHASINKLYPEVIKQYPEDNHPSDGYQPQPQNYQSHQQLSANSQPQSDGFQSHSEILPPQSERFQPQSEKSFQPHVESYKPQAGGYLSQSEGYQASSKNFQPHSENSQPHSENFQPHSENFQPHSENFQPHSENFQPHSENFQPHSENFQPHSENFLPKSKPKSEPQTGGYQSKTEGYQAQSEGYQSQSEDYQSQPEGYKSPSGTFQQQSQYFRSQPQGYQPPPESFQQQPETYQTPSETYQSQPKNYQLNPIGHQQSSNNFQQQPENFQLPTKSFHPQPHQSNPERYQPSSESFKLQPEGYQSNGEGHQQSTQSSQHQNEGYQPHFANFKPQPIDHQVNPNEGQQLSKSFQPQSDGFQSHADGHELQPKSPQPNEHQPSSEGYHLRDGGHQSQPDSYQSNPERHQPQPESYQGHQLPPESYQSHHETHSPQFERHPPQVENPQSRPEIYRQQPESNQLHVEGRHQQSKNYQLPSNGPQIQSEEFHSKTKSYSLYPEVNQQHSEEIQNQQGKNLFVPGRDCTQDTNGNCATETNYGRHINNDQRSTDDGRNRQTGVIDFSDHTSGRKIEGWNAESDNFVVPSRRPSNIFQDERNWAPDEDRFSNQPNGADNQPWNGGNNQLTPNPNDNNYRTPNNYGQFQDTALNHGINQFDTAGPNNFEGSPILTNIESGQTGEANSERPTGDVESPVPFEFRNHQGNYKGEDGVIYPGNRNANEDSIPGTPGVNYPNYSSLPTTNFDCKKQEHTGYYADTETQCQVYHICQADGRQSSFLCPVGTIFNQKLFTCDWWYNYDCSESINYYSLNVNLYTAIDNFKGTNFPGGTRPTQQQFYPVGVRQPEIAPPGANFGTFSNENSGSGVPPPSTNFAAFSNGNLAGGVPPSSTNFDTFNNKNLESEIPPPSNNFGAFNNGNLEGGVPPSGTDFGALNNGNLESGVPPLGTNFGAHNTGNLEGGVPPPGTNFGQYNNGNLEGGVPPPGTNFDSYNNGNLEHVPPLGTNFGAYNNGNLEGGVPPPGTNFDAYNNGNLERVTPPGTNFDVYNNGNLERVPPPGTNFGALSYGNLEDGGSSGVSPVYRNEVRGEITNLNENVPQGEYNQRINGQGRIEQTRNDFNAFNIVPEGYSVVDSDRRQNNGMNERWNNDGHPENTERSSSFHSRKDYSISNIPEFWKPGGPRMDDIDKLSPHKESVYSHDNSWIKETEPIWNGAPRQRLENRLTGKDEAGDQNSGFIGKDQRSLVHGDTYYHGLNSGIRRIGDDVEGSYEFTIDGRPSKEENILEDKLEGNYEILIPESGVKELNIERRQRKHESSVENTITVKPLGNSSYVEGNESGDERNLGIASKEEGRSRTFDGSSSRIDGTTVRKEENLKGKEYAYGISLPQTSESRTLGSLFLAEKSSPEDSEVRGTSMEKIRGTKSHISGKSEEKYGKEMEEAEETKQAGNNIYAEELSADIGIIVTAVDHKNGNLPNGNRSREKDLSWRGEIAKNTAIGSGVRDEAITFENKRNDDILMESATGFKRGENFAKLAFVSKGNVRESGERYDTVDERGEQYDTVDEQGERYNTAVNERGEKYSTAVDERGESRSIDSDIHALNNSNIQNEEEENIRLLIKPVMLSKQDGNAMRFEENEAKRNDSRVGYRSWIRQAMRNRLNGSNTAVLGDRNTQTEENLTTGKENSSLFVESVTQPRREGNINEFEENAYTPKRNASKKVEDLGARMGQILNDRSTESYSPVVSDSDVEEESTPRGDENVDILMKSATRARQQGVVVRSKENVIITSEERSRDVPVIPVSENRTGNNFNLGEELFSRKFKYLSMAASDPVIPSRSEGNVIKYGTTEVELEEVEGKDKHFVDSRVNRTKSKAISSSLKLVEKETNDEKIFGSQLEPIAVRNLNRDHRPPGIRIRESEARNKEKYRASEETTKIGRVESVKRPERISKKDGIHRVRLGDKDLDKDTDLPSGISRTRKIILKSKSKNPPSELKISEERLRKSYVPENNSNIANTSSIFDAYRNISDESIKNSRIIYSQKPIANNTFNSTDFKEYAQSKIPEIYLKLINGTKTTERKKVRVVMGRERADLLKAYNETENENSGVYRKFRVTIPVRNRNYNRISESRTVPRDHLELNDRNSSAPSL